MIRLFDGKDAFENFSEWTDYVNLNHGEIKQLIVIYERKK